MRLSIKSGLTSSLALSLLSACASSPAKQATVTTPAPQAVTNQLKEAPVKETELLNLSASGNFLAPLPKAVTSFGAASDANSFYVVGGYSGTPHAYSKEGQHNEILKLDTSGHAGWETIGNIPDGLQGLFAIHHQGKLCVFGGNHAANAAGSESQMRSVKDARCFDLEKKTWTVLPNLPKGRSSFGGAMIGSKIYLAGGWTLEGSADSGVFVDDILVLDLADPKADWTTIPAPFKRRAVGVAALGNRLIIVGGMTEDEEISRAVNSFDTVENKWTTGAEYPGDAFGISVTSDEKAIYASAREGLLMRWSPDKSEWEKIRHLGFPRFFHESRFIGDELVIVGGISGMHTHGRTKVVERLPKDASLSYGSISFDSPMKVKNRFGFLRGGEGLYLFGGNRSTEQHDFEREDFDNQGYYFNFAALKMKEAPAYPLRRQSMQTLDTETGGISIGGFGHEPLEDEASEASEAISHPEMFRFDQKSQSWIQAGSLPRGRTQFGLTKADGKYWIFGGLNYDPSRDDAFQHDTSIWVADESEELLQFKAIEQQLPAPRRAFAGAQLDGKYYFIGGMKAGFELVSDCISYEFAQKKFETIPCPAPRLSGDLVPAGGKLYLIGGSVRLADGIQESRSVEVFDPKTQIWSKVDFEFPESTRHLRAIPYRNQILLFTANYEEAKMSFSILNPGN